MYGLWVVDVAGVMGLTSCGEGEITLADRKSWVRTTLATSPTISTAVVVPCTGETHFFSLLSELQ